MKKTIGLYVHTDRTLWELDMTTLDATNSPRIKLLRSLSSAYTETLPVAVLEVTKKFAVPPFMLVFDSDLSFIMNMPVAAEATPDLSELTETDKRLFTSSR